MNTHLIKRPALKLPIAIPVLLAILFVFTTHIQTENYFSNAAPTPSELKQIHFSGQHIETRPPTQLGFIANDSQASSAQFYDSDILFYTPIKAGTFYISRSGELYYNLHANQTKQIDRDRQAVQPSIVLKETLVGAQPGYIQANSDSQLLSIIKGPSKPLENHLDTYDNISMGEIYPNIELVLNAHADNVEKIFIVSPRGDTAQIKLAISGIDNAEITANGMLAVYKNNAKFYFTKPIAFQYIDGKRIDVSVDYKLEKTGGLFHYGFELGHYNKNVPVIIDPLLASTYLGGDNSEGISALFPGTNNSFYVAGGTWSPDFPTSLSAFAGSSRGRHDGFITHFDNNLESALHSTYIGGSDFDRILAALLDSKGNIVVAGETSSADFPTTQGAYDETYNGTVNSGSTDIFIAKLSPDLSTLIAATYLGGSAATTFSSFCLDSADNIIITGHTRSTDFPTTSKAYNTSSTGAPLFVSIIDSSLSKLVASTYLGLSNKETVVDVETDSQGNIFILGDTTSPDKIPATAYDLTYNGGYDTFIIKLAPNLASITSATYFGGFGLERPRVLMLDEPGKVYIAGSAKHSQFTNKTEFPTTINAYQTIDQSRQIDIYISKFDNNLSVLEASTLLGGIGSDSVQDMLIDDANLLNITGSSGSTDYPTSENAYNRHNVGAGDVIISKMTTDLTTLVESTRLGAAGGDIGLRIALDAQGNVFVAGLTNSEKFPVTANAFDKKFISVTDNGFGTNEIFVSKFTSDLAGSRFISVSPESFEFTIPADNTTVLNQSILITNIGTGYVKIASISIEKPNLNFSVIGDNCGYTFDTIAPKENCNAVVAFRNVSPGINKATLLITSDDTVAPEIRVTLTASNTSNSGGNGSSKGNGNTDSGGGSVNWIFILGLLIYRLKLGTVIKKGISRTPSI